MSPCTNGIASSNRMRRRKYFEFCGLIFFSFPVSSHSSGSSSSSSFSSSLSSSSSSSFSSTLLLLRVRAAKVPEEDSFEDEAASSSPSTVLITYSAHANFLFLSLNCFLRCLPSPRLAALASGVSYDAYFLYLPGLTNCGRTCVACVHSWQQNPSNFSEHPSHTKNKRLQSTFGQFLCGGGAFFCLHT